MKQEYTEPVFVFYGSAEKIAQEQAMVSHFRQQNGMNPNPSGSLVGTSESIARQKVMIAQFRKQL